jgi:PIG-X / PBN1
VLADVVRDADMKAFQRLGCQAQCEIEESDSPRALSVSYDIVGSGAHRTLVISMSATEGEEDLSTHLALGLVITAAFPPSLFLDPFEIQRASSTSSWGSGLHVCGHVDLEKCVPCVGSSWCSPTCQSFS